MMPASALPAVAGQTTATAAKANLTVVFFPGFETIGAMGPCQKRAGRAGDDGKVRV